MKRRRGIYLLPNLFTTAALFAGFYSIVSAMNGHFKAAAICIFIAMVLDGMDGRIARLTKTQSDFGMQYDSLSDMVSFGLAPALIVYQWSLFSLDKLGWLAAFIYAATTALRLARFNAQAGSADKKFFQGLPSPAAAALIAGMIWAVESYSSFYTTTPAALAFIITVAAALLMVSNIRFHSFKEFDLRGKVRFVTVLSIVLIFVFIALDPPLVLFIIVLGYVLSGPVITLVTIRKHRLARNRPEDTEG